MELIEEIKLVLRERELNMNPPPEDIGILEFEKKNNVKLPVTYRSFIKKIGNDGEGPPCNGLLKLGEVPDDFGAVEKENYLPGLDEGFPHEVPWIWEGEDESEADFQKFKTIQYGNICLDTDGCGLNWHLIVNGKESGMVWQVRITHLYPSLDFTEWYLSWLQGNDHWFAADNE